MTAQSSDARAELRALTGIRAFALCWVIFAHLALFIFPFFPRSTDLVKLFFSAQLAVDTFFILSGFVLTLNYADALARFRVRTAAHFIGLRLARIYPVHLVAVVSWLVLAGVASLWDREPVPDVSLEGWNVVRNLLLLQFVPPTHPINPPSWSLGAEAGAYLAFPLFVIVIARVRRGWVGLTLAAGLLIAESLITQHRYLGEFDFGTYSSGWFRLVMGFIAGCLLARGWQHLERMRIGQWWDAAFVVGAVGLALVVGLTEIRHTIHLPALAFPFLGLMVVGAAGAAGHVKRMLGYGPIYWLAVRSYSIYMTHYFVVAVAVLVLDAGSDHFHSNAAQGMFVLVVLGAITVVGALTFRWIEEPARRAMRRRLDRLVEPATV